MKKGIIVLVLAAGAIALVVKLASDGDAPRDGGTQQSNGEANNHGEGDTPVPPPKEGLMTEINSKQVEAIGIDMEAAVRAASTALASLAGKAEVDKQALIVVSKKAGQIEVVFKTTLPATVRGPDYAAKVTLDAATGEVVQILGSS